MECRNCGRDLTGAEDVKMVAQWPFCEECFEKLMTKPSETEAAKLEEVRAEGAASEASSSSPPAGSSEARDSHCEICGILLKGQAFKVGIWRFCADCFKELVVVPRREEATDAPSPQGQETEGEDHSAVGTKEEEPSVVARMQVGFMRSVLCSGCRRRIPEGGARMVDGQPLCPDCFVRLSVEESGLPFAPAVHEESTAAGEPRSRTPANTAGEALLTCESCGRAVAPDRLKSVEGFMICSACLATDPSLAVDIARTRHKKRLEDMRKNLAGS